MLPSNPSTRAVIGILGALSVTLSLYGNGNVNVTRFWHNHQPIYWPEWNSNGSEISRVQYAWDSIVLKPGQDYGGTSSTTHPENDLGNIFGLDDRRNSYQWRPRDSLNAINSAGGFAISYSGSLFDNVRQLGSGGNLGYSSNWNSAYQEARGWTTPSGSSRLDLVGFTYHHSLAPLLPKEVFRKELQIFKEGYWKAWNGNPNHSDHSKGFFPTEMAYTSELIDVLVEEGYEWVIVASHHISRTCPTYFDHANPVGSFNIKSSPPNRADLLGPSPTSGWWFDEPNPGQAAWNVSPYAYQLHKVKYVNPTTGTEKTMIAVPSDDVMSYAYGYSDSGISRITSNISPYATDPTRPVIVMPSSDGDNAWGGGYSSWMEATPNFFSSSSGAGYNITTPQDFVNAHGAAATEVHIEDGAWIFPESDYGSPYFLKWIEPPLENTYLGANNNYPNTKVDLETPGFALKFYSYAPLMAGANWVQTAEQIWEDDGGTVEAWKIQAPYDGNGTPAGANIVELAWHIYLCGLDSGFNYYGGLGNDDEVKPGLATRRAIEQLQGYMSTRMAQDATPPTVLRPQRFPYNPGGYTFGWFNPTPSDGNYLKQMGSEFYVWTHAYDISGITSVSLKIRRDIDGVRSLANNHNETYAGGADVEAWTTLPMAMRTLPNTRTELNAAANSGDIDYFITSPEIADYYFVRIDETSRPGFRDNLFDYYIEAVDTLGNVHKSEIQHVYVEDDQQATTPPDTPTGLNVTGATSSTVSLSWTASATATTYTVRRGGTIVGTPAGTGFTDNGLSPEIEYCYTVSANNNAGSSAETASVCATTDASSGGGGGTEPPPFILEGTLEFAGYLHSNPGMTLYAAIRGTKLYVSTWAAVNGSGNDHFILISDALLPSATGTAPWAKAGNVAVDGSTKPFLAAEADNSYIGWFNVTGTSDQAKGSSSADQMEGTFDLVEQFGTPLPDMLYIASAAYQTPDGGALGSQAPDAVGTPDGNIDPAEFLALPVSVLADNNGDGIFDVLDSEIGFKAELSSLASPGSIRLTWPVIPGRSYTIQYLDTLNPPTWQDLSGASYTAGSGDSELSHDHTPGAGQENMILRIVGSDD